MWVTISQLFEHMYSFPKTSFNQTVQKEIFPSMDDAASLLSSSQRRLVTDWEWNGSTRATWPLLTAKARIVPSKKPPKRVDPVGEKQRELTPPALNSLVGDREENWLYLWLKAIWFEEAAVRLFFSIKNTGDSAELPAAKWRELHARAKMGFTQFNLYLFVEN